jgi:hypothetical protein
MWLKRGLDKTDSRGSSPLSPKLINIIYLLI